MTTFQSMKSQLTKEIPVSAIILGLALTITGLFIMLGLSGLRPGTNTIVSTGSARERVTADLAKLNADITVRVPASEIKRGYVKIANDKKIVAEFIKTQGIADTEVTFGSVYASEVWNNDNGPREFDVKQSVSISSNNLQKVKQVADNSNSVIQSDVMFQAYSVEYYYSKLPDKRRELLGKAVEDAKARAEEIAKSAGNRVGELRSARAGVVQVLAPNSQNVDDYGTYDTSTIEKDIVVSANATFSIK